jgi:hypothetical protein
MINQIKNYLIAAGALMIIVSYFTDDAMRKIDCGMIGLAMWILFLMFKKEKE